MSADTTVDGFKAPQLKLLQWIKTKFIQASENAKRREQRFW